MHEDEFSVFIVNFVWSLCRSLLDILLIRYSRVSWYAMMFINVGFALVMCKSLDCERGLVRGNPWKFLQ